MRALQLLWPRASTRTSSARFSGILILISNAIGHAADTEAGCLSPSVVHGCTQAQCTCMRHVLCVRRYTVKPVPHARPCNAVQGTPGASARRLRR